MQFRKLQKEAIRAGRITCSFRAWRRPQAKLGGRYNLHPEGAIEVTELTTLAAGEITQTDAERAGFASAAAVRDELAVNADETVYRLIFRYLGSELVKQPDQNKAATWEFDSLRERLQGMDNRAATPWTLRVLTTLAEQPGTRAADLAPFFGWDTPRFKAQVRKLKALGLTISLETGYKISPRGRQILDSLADPEKGNR